MTAVLDYPDVIHLGELGFVPDVPSSPLIVDEPPLDPETGEPVVQVDEMVLDFDGTPWTRGERGWMAPGDWRQRPWKDVQQWF